MAASLELSRGYAVRVPALERDRVRIIVELLVFYGLCVCVLLMTHGVDSRSVELASFMLLLMVAAYNDYRRFIIPNAVVLVGIMVRMAFLIVYAKGSFALYGKLLASSALNGLLLGLPVAFFALLVSWVRKREVFGGGDIKLLFMCGMFFDLFGNLIAMFLTCLVASVMGLVLCMHNRTIPFEQVIPFGVPLAFSYCAMASAGGLLSTHAM